MRILGKMCLVLSPDKYLYHQEAHWQHEATLCVRIMARSGWGNRAEHGFPGPLPETHYTCFFLFFFFFLRFYSFIHERHTQRERQRHRQSKKQAPCREPDVGLDPRSPGSGPGLKAALNH